MSMRFGFPSRNRRKTKSKLPLEFENLLSSINCKLIETQRLIIFDDDYDDRFHDRRGSRPIHAISHKADALKRIILSEMSKYANLSQSLDRTFPRRVIAEQSMIGVSNINDRLIELDERRQSLMEVGILDADEDVQLELPDKELQDAVARVLSVYIEDNQKKLDSLSSIYKRVKLFKELMSQRFGTKKVDVSKSGGLKITHNDNEVPLDRLSSGEQHQLVLFFELLFEIKPNTLILIDEPEISLHVAWQKKFISDLMKIIDLNKFDVMLATHSPQLIGGWSDLLVELGDVN